MNGNYTQKLLRANEDLTRLCVELEEENKMLTKKLAREVNRNTSFENVRQNLYKEIKELKKGITWKNYQK